MYVWRPEIDMGGLLHFIYLGLFLNLGLADLASLANQLAPRIPSFLPPECWDYRLATVPT